MSINEGAQLAIILLACGPYVVIVNCWDRFCTLGRAPRTKETLPDFHEWCRVTRHPRAFRGLTGCQRTPRFLGVTTKIRDIFWDPSQFNFPNVLQLVRLLVKANDEYLKYSFYPYALVIFSSVFMLNKFPNALKVHTYDQVIHLVELCKIGGKTCCKSSRRDYYILTFSDIL